MTYLTHEELNSQIFKDLETYNPLRRFLISRYIPEGMLRRYTPKFNEDDWMDISQFQKLSETFIEDYSDKLNWLRISYYQELSEDFIKRHENEVDWEEIQNRQTLSKEFIKEFQSKF